MRFDMTDSAAFNQELHRRAHDAFVGATGEVQRSVVEGSEVTGAPGQPVHSGTLKGSWIDRFLEPFLWRTTTKQDHAPAIEDGQQQPYTTANGTRVSPRPMTLRSTVGGFHSVALTRAGWQRVANEAMRRVRKA